MLLVAALVGCGSSSTETPQAQTVTIAHKFGETKVPENPQRVVTVGWTDQDFVLPFGVIRTGPRDHTVRACARLILEPSATRDRLTEGVYIGDEAVGRLEQAFDLVVRTQPIHDRLRARRIRDWRTAAEQGLLTPEEMALLKDADDAVADVVAVDDFAPEDLARGARPRSVPHAAE